jgi:uncharacterized MAPEG superfamily protein
MTLENILILSFLLVIIQISIPVIIDLVITNKIKFNYLFSSRDNPQDTSEFFGRASRALRNLFETLPIFIGLVIISIIKGVDNSSLALLWLISRTIYIPLYIFGINYIRTGAWAVALICLIMMSVKFM